jgi:hypothetical protein
MLHSEIRPEMKLLARKPPDREEPPGWEWEMDEYNGRILTVSEVDDDWIYFHEAPNWAFSPNWLEEVTVVVVSAGGACPCGNKEFLATGQFCPYCGVPIDIR